MNAIKYLLQVNFYLILFYGFYRILLRNETFHGNNRLFLVAGAMFSLLIPVWQFDWVQQLFLTEQVSEAVVYYMAPMQVVAIRPQAKPITWADLCFWIYVIGGVIFSIRFIINILNLRKLLMGGVMAFRAFTFGRKIYIDKNLPESQTILKHENVHAQQLHSFDVVFFEIMLIFNWFNPILYAYRQSIKNIHEFLADEIAAQDFGKANYARLLLSQEFGVSPSVFTHQFLDQSSLKQRIIMLAKPKSKKAALLKYGLSMPLFVAMLIVSSACTKTNDGNESTKNESANEKTIVPPNPPMPSDLEEVLTTVENQAEYPGGIQEMYKFLGENLKYPAKAQRANVEGKIFLQFIIKKDGSISDIVILKGIGFGCDEEAIRVIKAMPNWTPAKHQGEIVNSRFTLPISFMLE